MFRELSDIWDDVPNIHALWFVLDCQTVQLIKLLGETEDEKVLIKGGEHWYRFCGITRVVVGELLAFKETEAEIDEGTYVLVGDLFEMLDV